eukprot:TRINITY_DN67558_c6_g2_i2.p1 TRINITY_DN67558_c6_g2~~TRINITY_DN67558_c6_g2_i2.p1  ORF type:complete len:252 (-),score=13.82 TRINITY_DN67558_c6_g2_i2:691-1446(-)
MKPCGVICRIELPAPPKGRSEKTQAIIWWEGYSDWGTTDVNKIPLSSEDWSFAKEWVADSALQTLPTIELPGSSSAGKGENHDADYTLINIVELCLEMFSTKQVDPTVVSTWFNFYNVHVIPPTADKYKAKFGDVKELTDYLQTAAPKTLRPLLKLVKMKTTSKDVPELVNKLWAVQPDTTSPIQTPLIPWATFVKEFKVTGTEVANVDKENLADLDAKCKHIFESNVTQRIEMLDQCSVAELNRLKNTVG